MDEIHRLRSDEWLERAAAEIGNKWGTESYTNAGGMTAILRKHRDGKA